MHSVCTRLRLRSTKLTAYTVLRTLCHNPNGMFWAGDTAQTISVGSAFRFNDLKSFLYRYEEVDTVFLARCIFLTNTSANYTGARRTERGEASPA